VRRGVRSLLLSRADIEICAEVGNGRDAIEKALKCQPDVIILDLTMPVMGGFPAAIELRRLLPETAILFYSMHEGEHLVKEAKRIGVHGFVSKSNISETLLQAVDVVVGNKTFFPD
jgi:DNA-binding NarL/FixJ family response regulator